MICDDLECWDGGRGLQGDSGGRGCMCNIFKADSCCCMGNQHNLVKQLSSSQKKKQLIAAEILAINKGLR